MKSSILKNMQVALAISLVMIFSGMSFAMSGSGTESSPYLIGTASDLKEFAKKVNDGKNNAWAKLTADIELNANDQWTPIGTSAYPFGGTFDGNNFVISHLNFNDESRNDVGLFGVVDGIVKNVGVENSSVKGKNNVGGVAGRLVYNGKISNVYYSLGLVSGTDYVGGVLGCNRGAGDVSYAYNTGSVSGMNYVGGVVGGNDYNCKVRLAYNMGSVIGVSYVGGVVGDNEGSVSDVYNTGKVSGKTYVGGVVGCGSSESGGSVRNVYNIGVVIGTDIVGSVVGAGSDFNAYYISDIVCKNCRDNRVGGPTGLSILESAKMDLPSENWNAGGNPEDLGGIGRFRLKLPSIKNLGGQQEFMKGYIYLFSTNAEGVYEIMNATHLDWFAQLVNSGKASINGKLVKDIVLTTQWTPIGTTGTPYTGTFDGGNFSISGLYLDDANRDSVGFFGRVGEKGVLKNFKVVDSYIKGKSYVGNVVGYNEGSLSNVYIENGLVSGAYSVGGIAGYNKGSLSNVSNKSSVSGGYYAGGVVGYNSMQGSVCNVSNKGSVSGTTEVGGVVGYNTGTVCDAHNERNVNGYHFVGGIVGYNASAGGFEGSVSKAYNTGVVEGLGNYVGGVVGYNTTSVDKAYSAGSVIGVENVGGVVGRSLGSVRDVYNTSSVSGTSNVGGVVGHTTKESTTSGVYNIGSVAGTGGKVNRVIGYNEGSVSYAYYYSDMDCASCEGNVSGVVAKTPAGLASKTLLSGFSSDNWATGSGEEPVVSNEKLVYKLIYLKDVGSQPEVEYTGFLPNNGVYEIGTVQQLKLFAEFVNKGSISINGKLTANIKLNAGKKVLDSDGSLYNNGSGLEQWTPIGTSKTPFKGTFDGNGHTISGLYFNNESKDSVGLFGYVGSSGKVMNVGVEDSYIKGRNSVGGVVGRNEGSVSNVYNTGSVSGDLYVGGVVGYNYRGTVSGVYNTGSVSGGEDVGGVVGYVYSGTVSGVYNTGSVSGGEDVGGVVGDKSSSGTVSEAYYNTNTACSNCRGFYGTGKTTWELATTTLFTSADNWVAGSVKSDLGDGRVVVLLPGLKNVGTQPEMECNGFAPNADGVVEISSAQKLKDFARFVNDGNTSVTAKLTANIKLNASKKVLNSDGTLYNNGSGLEQWTPIGTTKTPFKGTFDGNGYKISGLYFNNESKDSVGLFGVVGSSGKVMNVGVEDSYIKGRNSVGGVVGRNDGGTVSDVYNTGSVSGTNSVGGVVGYNYSGTVSDVYNMGAVSGSSNVGGVVGDKSSGTISEAYYNTNTDCSNCSGSYGTGKTTWELATTTLSGLFTSGDNWVAGSVKSDLGDGRVVVLLPGLKNVGTQPEMECNGFAPNADGVFEISSAQKLKGFARFVNDGNTSVTAKLTANISLNEKVLNSDGTLYNNGSGLEQWTPIGTTENPFKGTFDGNGHTISGLYFNNESIVSVGLFGHVGSNGKVMNVGVEDSYIRGQNYVGGMVGYNEGSVSVAYNTGSVSGIDLVGGVVGYVYSGTVSDVYNMGAVSGNSNVGGVVGYNSGTVSGVYNTGIVSGNDNVGGVAGYNTFGSVGNVYNTGAVSGRSNVGGVVGYNTWGHAGDVYNIGNVSGSSYVGGVAGYADEGSISDSYYSTTECRNCEGAVNGSDDKSHNVIGITNDEFAEKGIAYFFAFYNQDGSSVLKQEVIFAKLDFVPKTPVPPSYSVPVKPDNDYYHYFSGWSPRIVPATKNEAYRAVLDSSLKRIDVSVVMMDGSPISISTTSECVNLNLTSLYENDSKVSLTSSDKLKGGNIYSGEFGLNVQDSPKCLEDDYVKSIMAPGSDVKIFVNGEESGKSLNAGNGYVAENVGFSVLAKYSITFLNIKGEFLQTSLVSPDETPVPPSYSVPLKLDNDYYHYFSGWSPRIVPATKNETYRAVLDSSLKRIDVTLNMLEGHTVSATTSSKCVRISFDLFASMEEHATGPKLTQLDPSSYLLLPNVTYMGAMKISLKKTEECLDDDYVNAITAPNSDVKIYVNGEEATTTLNGSQTASLNSKNKYSTTATFSGTAKVTSSIERLDIALTLIDGKPISIGVPGEYSGCITTTLNQLYEDDVLFEQITQSKLKGGKKYKGSFTVSFAPAEKGSGSSAGDWCSAIANGITRSSDGVGIFVNGVDTHSSLIKKSQTGTGLGHHDGPVVVDQGISAQISFEEYAKYVVKFVDSDGTTLINGTVEPDELIPLALVSAAIDKASKGSSIQGWYADPKDRNKRWNFEEDVVDSSLTLTADYERTDFGAVTIAADHSSATIDGASTLSVADMDGIEITGPISLQREFVKTATASSFSSLMLPFKPKSKPAGISFYSFVSVSKINGKWTVSVRNVEEIEANTPYLVQVGSGTTSIDFADGGTFKATAGEHLTTEGNWNLVGTYEYKKWQEGDPGLGYDYGFAGSKDNDPAIVGKFVKIGAGAYIYPMRAYLEYKAPAQPGRPAAPGEKARSVKASLPESMDVMVIEKSETGEETTRVIGSFNTRTGEFKASAERYYDMKGRHLGKKRPNVKGVYNNGKKVFVK